MRIQEIVCRPCCQMGLESTISDSGNLGWGTRALCNTATAIVKSGLTAMSCHICTSISPSNVTVLQYAFAPTRHAKAPSNHLDMIHKQTLILWTEGAFAVKYVESGAQDQICECKSVLVPQMNMEFGNFPLISLLLTDMPTQISNWSRYVCNPHDTSVTLYSLVVSTSTSCNYKLSVGISNQRHKHYTLLSHKC